MIKLKWVVCPAPTGRYKSFEKRGWPSGEYEDGTPAFWIVCNVAYIPANVKTGDHPELTIRVANHSYPNTFKWETLKQRAKTLKGAKEIAQAFINKYPSLAPKSIN